MAILDRITMVIRSNLNALINQAEDPEKMLDQILIDMRQQLQEAKREVAVAIADEKRLAAQVEAGLDQVREWDRRAVLAVQRGEDDLAREALRRKAEQEQLAASYKTQWEAQKASTEALKNALRALSEKIEEAARKKNLLIARQKRAQAQKHIHEVMSGLSDTSAFEAFDRMAARVEQTEAQAAATVEISQELSGETTEQRFRALEASADVEQELMALKARVQKELPSSS
ncbi:MAG TPA: PspA/IM30 family protein [Candidatus Tectomicrobia bacterium]|jgi:phage shock protein A|nr:PspA/IM30 family protein [Candidatus Tectomicrobia bacterium]